MSTATDGYKIDLTLDRPVQVRLRRYLRPIICGEASKRGLELSTYIRTLLEERLANVVPAYYTESGKLKKQRGAPFQV